MKKEINFEQAHRLAATFRQLGRGEDFLNDEEIPLELRKRVWNFIEGKRAKPTNSIPGSSYQDWYEDIVDDSNWIRYVDLLNRKNWSEESIQNIDATTKKILNFSYNPKEEGPVRKYGLVVGHVQSGKTANFTGLLARAADSGYNLFIVLAGLHNNLRLQTQIRLEKELLGKSKDSMGNHVSPPINYDWNMLTRQDHDYLGLPDWGGITGLNTRSIAIIKKNKSPLTKLRDTLSEIPIDRRMKLNIMIIDDESDHATINTMIPKKENYQDEDWFDEIEDEEYEEDEEIKDATTINTRLREIIQLFPRCSYIGYTATPFANVLIDPQDTHERLGNTLYPRDFILALPKPDGHMGLTEFFPDLLESEHKYSQQVKIVPPLEAEKLRLLNDESGIDEEDQRNLITGYEEIPESLENAVIDYFLSGAAKYARGMENFNHSMLVHVKHTDRNQSPLWRRLKSLIDHWSVILFDSYSGKHETLKERFYTRWVEEFLSHPNTNEHWDDIWPEIQRFFSEGFKILKINYKSQHDMNFNSNRGLHVIAVGGNRLSRGLTIEGLTCSYFIRESKMYDTLTQMGRWFGFREKYRDLVRIHVTPNLLEWFTWLTGVERELRDDITRYQDTGLTPSDLAVRILKHRKMLPTSKSKMRAAKIFRGGLDESCPRNKKFCYSNPLTLRNNLLVTGEFLSSLGKTNPLDFDKSLLWRGVDADVILSYLQAMIFHENDNSFNEIDISRHINTRLAKNELNNWSVGLINNSKGKINSPLMEGGFDHSFGLPTRSRLSGKESIGELMQSIHFALDLPGKREKYRIDGKFSYNRMYQERKPENPLLLIYVIDKDSEISSQSKQPRQVLFNQYQERVDIVALAIAFPKANMTEEERSEQNRDYFALGGIANEPENDAE